MQADITTYSVVPGATPDEQRALFRANSALEALAEAWAFESNLAPYAAQLANLRPEIRIGRIHGALQGAYMEGIYNGRHGITHGLEAVAPSAKKVCPHDCFTGCKNPTNCAAN